MTGNGASLYKKQLEDDSTSEQFLRAVDKSYLYLKLGSKRALRVASVDDGGFRYVGHYHYCSSFSEQVLSFCSSVRHSKRLAKSDIFPTHDVLLSPNCGPLGQEAIRINMEAITGESYKAYLPDERCLVVIMVDGIAVQPRVCVDVSVRPMMLAGLC